MSRLAGYCPHSFMLFYLDFVSFPDSWAFLLLIRFWRTRERLYLKRVTSLLSMRCMLLGYSFEPRPNSRELGSEGSAVTIGLSIKINAYAELWSEKERRKNAINDKLSNVGNWQIVFFELKWCLIMQPFFVIFISLWLFCFNWTFTRSRQWHFEVWALILLLRHSAVVPVVK